MTACDGPQESVFGFHCSNQDMLKEYMKKLLEYEHEIVSYDMKKLDLQAPPPPHFCWAEPSSLLSASQCATVQLLLVFFYPVSYAFKRLHKKESNGK